VILSLIPPCTPIVMFLRITVLTPPVWQIALSILLTALTTAGVMWVSARIYRVGILMYGKRPTVRDIVAWMRS
jgi:ABC-2 type transport system permease protein